jgi:hypothetical protein
MNATNSGSRPQTQLKIVCKWIKSGLKQQPCSSGTFLALTSRGRGSIIMALMVNKPLMITENWEFWCSPGLQSHGVDIQFHENRQSGPNSIPENTYVHRHSYTA